MFRWITGGYEQEISFAEFKDLLHCDTETVQTLDTRSESEILADVRNILD